MLRGIMCLTMASIIFSSNYAQGQTIITGAIDESQIWTEEGSPYIIHGEVYILNDTALEIEPGTTILFESGALLGATDHSSFLAQGTEEAPILFSSNTNQPQPGDFFGLVLASPNATTLSHCVIEFAQTGLGLSIPLDVENVEIRNCVDGLQAMVVQGNVSGFYIHDNTRYGIRCSELTQADFLNCIIKDNGLVGIQGNISYSQVGADECIIQGNGSNGMLATAEVTNCNISHNGGLGLILVGGISASHNTIVGNSGYGIGVRDVLPDGSVHVNWCNIYNNGNYDFAVASSCYTPIVDAANNFWGTQNVEVISARIFDVNDDSNLTSQVLFSPYEGTVETERKTFGGIKSLYR